MPTPIRAGKASEARIVARVTEEELVTILRAAHIRGVSLSEFVRDAVAQAATKVIERGKGSVARIRRRP